MRLEIQFCRQILYLQSSCIFEAPALSLRLCWISPFRVVPLDTCCAQTLQFVRPKPAFRPKSTFSWTEFSHNKNGTKTRVEFSRSKTLGFNFSANQRRERSLPKWLPSSSEELDAENMDAGNGSSPEDFPPDNCRISWLSVCHWSKCTWQVKNDNCENRQTQF